MTEGIPSPFIEAAPEKKLNREKLNEIRALLGLGTKDGIFICVAPDMEGHGDKCTGDNCKGHWVEFEHADMPPGQLLGILKRAFDVTCQGEFDITEDQPRS